jgi:hypothetical protein
MPSLSKPVLAASVVENVCFDLTAVDADPLWVKTGVGAIITASDTINGGLEVTRTTWDVGGSNNWLIEAVVSSFTPGTPGEAGARIWVRANMDDLATPNQYHDIEVRLMHEASSADDFIGLYNHHDNLAQTLGGSDAKLILRWDQTAPRYRIRLMRQGNEIIMEAEPSNVFDDDPSKQSIAVPLNITNFPPLVGAPNMMQQVGFGNGMASGNQISTWENIHITVCDDATTILPYWPPEPPAPTLVHDDKGMDSPQGIDFSADLTGSGYLANDSVTPELDADGTTYYGETRTDPGSEAWDFDGLNDDQTVYGRVVASDVSGRSTIGPDDTTIIPDRTTPAAPQIADILMFFDDSVANGTLVGSGPGNSAKGRLGALRNMIDAAGDLISQGRITKACQQLQNAYLRVDGQPKPPEFATGQAAAQLANMIQQLINSLGG